MYIYIYIYMCVCMYVCMHVRTYIYIYIYTVKFASTTTSLKRPLALNDRFKSPPRLFPVYFTLIKRPLA